MLLCIICYVHGLRERALRQHQGEEREVGLDVRVEVDARLAQASELARERVLEVGATNLSTVSINVIIGYGRISSQQVRYMVRYMLRYGKTI